MQANFSKIDMNYLKKLGTQKQRDSQDNFNCNS